MLAHSTSDPWTEHRAKEVQREHAALQARERLIAELLDAVAPIWHWGDGVGGELWAEIERQAAARGLPVAADIHRYSKAKVKVTIPAELRWEVFRRDGFACKHCGVQRNLRADHIVPESKGGPATLENLQTLCARCNSKKGNR